MALMTDLVTPEYLTGYARAALQDIEENQASLAVYLPNREVTDISVRFVAGQSGFVPLAEFRAYDAEPTVGKRKPYKRHTIELPPISRQIPISEYDRLRSRGATNEQLIEAIQDSTRALVRGIVDRLELLRGSVLDSGKATIEEVGVDDDFGRDASHDIVLAAAKKWTDTSVSRLALLEEWADKYGNTNGVAPGSLLMSRKVFRMLASGDEFKTTLIGGAFRPATVAQVEEIIGSHGLPAINVYERKTSAGRVLPDNKLFMLPAPVATTAWEDTELGATFWGQTLQASNPAYKLAPAEQPGIVAATFEDDASLMKVRTDGIAMPVLANANLSLVATVA
jgi:hypothetical protein